MNRFKVPRRACGWGAGNGSQWGQAESAPGLGRPCPRLPSLGAGLSRIISVGPGLAWKLGSSFFLRTLRTQHLRQHGHLVPRGDIGSRSTEMQWERVRASLDRAARLERAPRSRQGRRLCVPPRARLTARPRARALPSAAVRLT